MGIMHELADSAEKLTHSVKETLGNTGDYVVHELDHILHKSALAGKILPVFQKLIVTPEKARLIGTKILEVTQWQDIVFILALGWATVPMIQYPYQKVAITSSADPRRLSKPFQHTMLYHAADHLSQIAKIALLVYFVDIIKIVLTCLGFTFTHLVELPHAFAKIVYSLWAAQRVSVFKKRLVVRHFQKGKDTLGRAQVVNRLLNAAILGATFMFIVDVLDVELGFAGKSIFAFGSVSTLVVSLASQGLAANVLNGLMLSASDRIYEGDQVRFGDGLAGTIVKLGWMETILRGSDEILLSIPNAELTSQRLSNLSRIFKCQVLQTLRFHYDDVDKIPALLDDIKEEIQEACPELITDGTRPFRVHWTGFEDDHVQVIVDVHFNVKPVGDAYWDNRQQVLVAIHKAVQKHNMQFALPVT